MGLRLARVIGAADFLALIFSDQSRERGRHSCKDTAPYRADLTAGWRHSTRCCLASQFHLPDQGRQHSLARGVPQIRQSVMAKPPRTQDS
jgi:hypothetical protein